MNVLALLFQNQNRKWIPTTTERDLFPLSILARTNNCDRFIIRGKSKLSRTPSTSRISYFSSYQEFEYHKADKTFFYMVLSLKWECFHRRASSNSIGLNIDFYNERYFVFLSLRIHLHWEWGWVNFIVQTKGRPMCICIQDIAFYKFIFIYFWKKYFLSGNILNGFHKL